MTNYAVKSGSQVSKANTRSAIRNREPFKTSGALKGVRHPAGSGQLSGMALSLWCADVNDISYVVYSYSTPIAWWHDPTGWLTVKDKFSVTTTSHQAVVSLALNTAI